MSTEISPAMPIEAAIAAATTTVCGVIDLLVTPFLSMCMLGYIGFFAGFCIAVPLGAPPEVGASGGLLGLAGCLLYPLGMAEIGVGLTCVLRQHPASARMLRMLSILQVCSVFFGGSASFVAGIVNGSLLWLSPTVRAYLDSDRRDW
jgi:hypothetical protein